MKKNTKSGYISLPSAIVIAATILAIAIIWASGKATPKAVPANTDTVPVTTSQGVNINMRAITSTDHIFGNPNAPIRIVEYSDPSCPFCKMFSPTIEKVADTYGASGNVAWIYRSFPLDKPDANGNILHKNAGHESQAIECAGSVGGNDKYWIFLRRLYAVTPSVTGQTPNGLDQSQLPVIAKFAGIDETAFNTCLDNGQMKAKVEADYVDGVNAGVNGTPFSIFVLSKPAPASIDNVLISINTQLHLPAGSLEISNDRTKIGMSGALPYETFQTIIDTILANK